MPLARYHGMQLTPPQAAPTSGKLPPPQAAGDAAVGRQRCDV